MSAITNCFASIKGFAQREEVQVVAPALVGTALAVLAAICLSRVGASPAKMLGFTVGPAMGGLIGSVAVGIIQSERSHRRD